MAITKRPSAPSQPVMDPAAAERFISGAPDAAPAAAAPAPVAVARSNVIKGNQVQVSFALPGELLVKVDQAADNLSISRAAFIKQALSRAVQAESS